MTNRLFDLTGKTALVTGGTGGVGLMIARGLLDAGATVYITSRKSDAGERAQSELSASGTVHFIASDLSKEQEVTRIAAELSSREPRLDILVNNAGATWGAPLADFPPAGWDKVLNLNVKAPFLLVQAFLPLLEAAGTAEDPARVINIGSIDGMRVPEFSTWSYPASKAAIHHLTRVLAKELGPRRITVNAIAPGPFPSKMMAATLAELGDEIADSSPLGRIGREDDMAAAAVYLSGRGAAWVTGVILPVDGGIHSAR